MLYIYYSRAGRPGSGPVSEEVLPEWAALHRKYELEAQGLRVEMRDIHGRAVSIEELEPSPGVFGGRELYQIR